MTFHLFLSLSWTMTLLILSLPLFSKQLSPGFLPIFFASPFYFVGMRSSFKLQDVDNLLKLLLNSLSFSNLIFSPYVISSVLTDSIII